MSGEHISSAEAGVLGEEVPGVVEAEDPVEAPPTRARDDGGVATGRRKEGEERPGAFEVFAAVEEEHLLF